MIRHKKSFGLLLVLVLCLIFPAVVLAHPAVYHGKHYQAGVTLLQQGKITQAIHELEHAVLQSPQGAYLRKLAEAYEANGQYQKAADTYYREAQVHLKRGDTDAYLVVKGIPVGECPGSEKSSGTLLVFMLRKRAGAWGETMYTPFSRSYTLFYIF